MNTSTLQPITEESGGASGEEGGDPKKGQQEQTEEWRVVVEKEDDVARRVSEHLGDDNGKGVQPPPMIRAPGQPIRDEYERHQITHTPYAAWCIHCAIARAVRTQHPSKGRNAITVPDIEKGITGPTNISMYYLYFCDRGDHRRVEQTNPHTS